jgi:hypothetical protein
VNYTWKIFDDIALDFCLYESQIFFVGVEVASADSMSNPDNIAIETYSSSFGPKIIVSSLTNDPEDIYASYIDSPDGFIPVYVYRDTKDKILQIVVYERITYSNTV